MTERVSPFSFSFGPSAGSDSIKRRYNDVYTVPEPAVLGDLFSQDAEEDAFLSQVQPLEDRVTQVSKRSRSDSQRLGSSFSALESLLGAGSCQVFPVSSSSRSPYNRSNIDPSAAEPPLPDVAGRVSSLFSLGFIPSVVRDSKRHDETGAATEVRSLDGRFSLCTEEHDFLTKESRFSSVRVLKVEKRESSDSPNSGSGSPISNGSSESDKLKISPVSSSSKSPDNRAETPPPAAKPAYKAPLPDMSAFETNYGAAVVGPQIPKTPAPKLRFDTFKLNIEDMLEEREIIIDRKVVHINEWLGKGRFSVVYRLSNGDVAKFPNDLEHTHTKKIQNDQQNASKQFEQLWEIREKLATINIGIVHTTFRGDGVVVQPFSESFVPSWNANTLVTDLKPREKLLLQTAKAAFAFLFKAGIPVDFRPSNMGLDPGNLARLNIRDFYEMDDDGDKFSDIVWDLLDKWALGNKAIYDYLDPRPKIGSPVRI